MTSIERASANSRTYSFILSSLQDRDGTETTSLMNSFEMQPVTGSMGIIGRSSLNAVNSVASGSSSASDSVLSEVSAGVPNASDLHDASSSESEGRDVEGLRGLSLGPSGFGDAFTITSNQSFACSYFA